MAVLNPLALLSKNLTPFENVELWVTRSCLLISASIIGPTVILIILDLLLWIIRAGHGPSTELLRRSKSGIDILQQRARRRSRSNSTTSSVGSTTGMEMTTNDKNISVKKLDEQLKRLDRLDATPARLKKEETDPVGGGGQLTASRKEEMNSVDGMSLDRQSDTVQGDVLKQRKKGTSDSPLTALNLGRVIQ